MQILNAIREAISRFKDIENNSVHDFRGADLLKTNGGEKNGTA